MAHFQYLLVMGLCLLVTLPLEFVFEARVWRRPRRLALALVPGFAAFVAWDLWATATGTWDFDPDYTIGVTLPGGMAIEELAFFVVVPVCTLLTLESVRNVLAGRVRLPGLGRPAVRRVPGGGS
jgi:lycopene beta-cyclase